MKVLILSTYLTTGGAAIAANRLCNALNKNGVEAKMMVRKSITFGPKQLRKQSWASLLERIAIWKHNGYSRKDLWSIDCANFGQDVTNTKEFKEADVIHIHWINQGFISLNTIAKIVKSGKRVVWTMHDEWPLDTIYHYTEGRMPQTSLTESVFQQKQQIYNSGRITFVTCSQWLANIAKAKELGKNQEVLSIPNPIDSSIFKPMDKESIRKKLNLPLDKKLILFTCQKVTDKRKGLDYLIEAAKELKDVGIVLVGRSIDEVQSLLPQHLETYNLGSITNVNLMAEIYAAADTFVTPSLQDNLPNTIMESMACGTPCVGFNVGGIPEMIDHHTNGYVAQYKNAHDLAAGINYVLDDKNWKTLSAGCIDKVRNSYSERTVAEKYLKVYQS